MSLCSLFTSSRVLFSSFHKVYWRRWIKDVGNFYDGGTEGRKKINQLAWDVVCVPKCNGGLNIKGCGNWNLASVCKLFCQLVVDKESLWVKWCITFLWRMTSISEHTNPKDYNWYWKILNALKDDLRAWYKHGKYNLTTGGELLYSEKLFVYLW